MAASFAVPEFVLAQPLPCACLNQTDPLLRVNANCSALLDQQDGRLCGYPYPESLGIPMKCVFNTTYQSYGWTPFPALPDVFFPENTLADFCTSNFFSDGNIFVPILSNVSLYRAVDGTGGGALVGSQIINYGYLLVTLNNVTSPYANKSTTPADGTVLGALYVAQRFDLQNRTQLWQGGQPKVKCQTIKFTPFLSNVTTAAAGNTTVLPLVGKQAYNLQMSVFDQCNYDATIFIIVVATVGGAIIVAAIIAAIVFVILAIKRSKANFNAGGGAAKYTEMDRGE